MKLFQVNICTLRILVLHLQTESMYYTYKNGDNPKGGCHWTRDETIEFLNHKNDNCMKTAWRGFKGNKWKSEVNLRDFIQNNYTPYEGDEKFLVGATDATNTLWGELQKLQKEERAKGGVLDMETEDRKSVV